MTLQTESHPVAIIGYGTAGVNAAIALRSCGYNGAIQVFSDHDTLPYSPILTSYYAGGQKSLDECFPWTSDELGDLHLETICEGPVIELDPEAHTVKTPSGSYKYSKCIVATGATPTTVGFPTVQGDESYKPLVLRSIEDAQRLKGVLESPDCKRMLISGASMVALKTLEACLNQDKTCTLVGMNPHVLDFNALPEIATRFEAGLRAQGVCLRLGQTIQAVKRTKDGLEVTFSTGDVEVFDEIAVSHGMASNLGFVKPDTLEIDRALIVDSFMRTSHPDIYAAGDVAQATELISGEKRIVGIWKNAAVQGSCAGAAIAAELAGEQPGDDVAFKGSISSNTIAVNGTLFISAGTMEINDSRRVEFHETDDMVIARIFQVEDGKPDQIVGFNLACDHDEPGGLAYDTGAMLTLRIEKALERA